MNLSPYGHMEMSQLVTMLIEARNIEEQVDILHFLVVTHGVDYTIHVKQVNRFIQMEFKSWPNLVCNWIEWIFKF